MSSCCLDGTAVAVCAAACEEREPALIEQFNSCSSGICDGDTCFRIFEPGGAVNVAACQDACNGMVFASCIDAEQHADCRDLCTRADRDAASTFEACAFGICDGPGCYETLRASVP
ncbi:MAG: hypothetical protein AB8I08_35640 [Sandaracinaceae bacterium]